VAANCTALPTANAGQYATSHCKPLLFWFPSPARTFNLWGYRCRLKIVRLPGQRVDGPKATRIETLKKSKNPECEGVSKEYGSVLLSSPVESRAELQPQTDCGIF